MKFAKLAIDIKMANHRQYKSSQIHHTITNQRLLTSSLALAVSLLLASSQLINQVSSQPQEVDKEGVPIPCIDNGKFYRNPIAANTRQDCGRYYQCYDNKVIMFRCNSDLYFDVDRQICDFKLKVSNCDKSHDGSTPRPLLVTEEPICPTGQLACADRKCLNKELFCDGQVDCLDLRTSPIVTQRTIRMLPSVVI